ncbi:MAG: DUF3137 domain-containing protein [Symploca sp. SIO2C1]|nr:DUF3137 domain-containing protein [Symploca sp. SIO2C1]
MNTIQRQLEVLYSEHNYRERLLDIENKRRQYCNKKLRFDRLSLIMAVTYFVLVFTITNGLWFLLSRENTLLAISIIIIVGVVIFSILRGWRTTRNYISSFLQICLSALLFSRKAVINCIEILFPSIKNREFFPAWEYGLRLILAIVLVIVGVNVTQGTNFLLFQGKIFAAIPLIIISGAGIYGILQSSKVIERDISSCWQIYSLALVEFRCEAVTSFTKIIYPTAKNIQFILASEFECWQKDSLGVNNSGLFYNNLEQYGERNQLTFSIDGLTYKVGEVELIFEISPGNQATEFDRFVYFAQDNSPTFGIFRGNFYNLPFLTINQTKTYLIPHQAAPIPLKNCRKRVTDWTGKDKYKEVKVSKDYPWLEWYGTASKKTPERFIESGFEEYTMENVDLEDRFHTFGNNENATRKLLSYQLMEQIVKAVPLQKSTSDGNLFSLVKQKKTWMCNFWFAMQQQRLLIARQQDNLMFFTQTGEGSVELKNVIDNFEKLTKTLQVIQQLNLLQANAQRL